MKRMNLIDQQNSLVIDVTYNCNATCKYCKWGNPKTDGRLNQPNEYVYIAEQTIKSLKTERVVFSGGEPLLRTDLEKIVVYYKEQGVESIIVVTNGFLLTSDRLEKLVKAGITGITFSVDGFSEKVAKETRNYTVSQLEKLIKHFNHVLSVKEKLKIEVGLNVVVSAINLQNNEIEKLIKYANNYKLDWIKFQPIFDDGYVGANASEMLLDSKHADLVQEVGENVIQNSKNETNPIAFWNSLSAILSGKKLKGESCGLDTRQAIAQKGDIKICSWIDYPKYSLISDNQASIKETQEVFSKQKANCKTGMFCYCLQKINHIWETE